MHSLHTVFSELTLRVFWASLFNTPLDLHVAKNYVFTDQSTKVHYIRVCIFPDEFFAILQSRALLFISCRCKSNTSERLKLFVPKFN